MSETPKGDVSQFDRARGDAAETKAREWVIREFTFDDSKVPQKVIDAFLKQEALEIEQLKIKDRNGEGDPIVQHPKLTAEQWVGKERHTFSHTNNMHARFGWERPMIKEALAKGEIPMLASAVYYLYKKGLLHQLFEDVGYGTIKTLCDLTKKFDETREVLLHDIQEHNKGYQLRGNNLQMIWVLDSDRVTPDHSRRMDELEGPLRVAVENECRKIHVALRKIGIPPWYMEG